MNKAARATSNFPTSEFLRKNLYKTKNTYRALCKKTSDTFFTQLNKDIENGKVLNWQQFKRLKSYKSNKIKFDSVDMNNFENFFTDLYSDNHRTIDKSTKDTFTTMSDKINNDNYLTSSSTLNDKISPDESNVKL